MAADGLSSFPVQISEAVSSMQSAASELPWRLRGQEHPPGQTCTHCPDSNQLGSTWLATGCPCCYPDVKKHCCSVTDWSR